jgi:AcrR family transcriptional regulator
VTAERLAERAGVSRSTLYALYASKEECVQTAIAEILDHLAAEISDATTTKGSPRRRLDRMVDAFTTFCAELPDAARLGLSVLSATGGRGAALRQEHLDAMTGMFRGELAKARPRAPVLTAEILTGGLLDVAVRRLQAGHERELPMLGLHLTAGLLGELTTAR